MTETSRTRTSRTQEDSALTVGRVAALVGVSVRTLHHWEQIGLVVASGRTWSDYRLYSPADIARIHRVLVYRELGLPLAEIGRILDDPDVDPREHLIRQRDLLAERIRRLIRTARAVDQMIERTTMTENDPAISLSVEEQTRIFGTDWDPAWQDDARERWGGTDAWQESARRTAAYTAEDWERFTAQMHQLQDDMAEAFGRGVDPASEEAATLVERHREWIGLSYDCDHARQVILARMYTEDPRFTAHYDKAAPGLAVWLRSAVEANARRHGVDPDTATWE